MSPIIITPGVASGSLGQLLTEFYAMGFDYLNDVNGPGATRATRWMNQSYKELCDADDWPFLEATAIGPAPLVIADLGTVESVLDTTLGVKLRPVDRRNLTDAWPDQTVQGAPWMYFINSGTTINVYPLNTTDSLTVRYWAVPTDLVALTDPPVVPPRFHDLIVLGAVRRGLLDDADAGDIQLVTAEYQSRLAAMRMALKDNDADRSSQIATFSPHEGF